MNKLLTISKYEYKMQCRRTAGWIALLFVIISALMDCLPTAANLARVEFLQDIHYYIRRVFSFDGLLLLFAIMFLLAGRLADDQKTGRRDLFMAAPIGKGSYLGGKLLGNFLYALTLMYVLLLVSLVGFFICIQTKVPLGNCIGAILEVSAYLIIPATFFIAASSVMLPELLDIRLFYMLFSVLFLINAFSSDTVEARPFYIFTQGDLAKIIWQHPKNSELHLGSAGLNLAFMLGTGLLSIVLASGKRRFWRAQ